MGRLNFALVGALLWTAAVATAVEKLPVEEFARQYTYQRVELSPDDRKLAVVFLRDEIAALGVLDLANSRIVGVTGVKLPEELGEVVWKSDNRLIYRSFRHDINLDYIPLLSAVDADGGHKVLFNYNPQPNGWYNYDSLLDPLREVADTVLIVSEADKHEYPTVYRANVQRTMGQPVIAGGRSGAQWPTGARRSSRHQAGSATIKRTTAEWCARV